MFKLDLEKAENWSQITNIRWIIEKAREFQKNIYFRFINYIKAFDCVDHSTLWKILRDRNSRPSCLVSGLLPTPECLPLEHPLHNITAHKSEGCNQRREVQTGQVGSEHAQRPRGEGAWRSFSTNPQKIPRGAQAVSSPPSSRQP